jgi:hypothetical protein
MPTAFFQYHFLQRLKKSLLWPACSFYPLSNRLFECPANRDELVATKITTVDSEGLSVLVTQSRPLLRGKPTIY